jgi:carbamoyltransferase
VIVLGISGLPGLQHAVNEKNKSILKQPTRVCQGLDSAAVIIKDGKIICAIAEERLTGIKGTGEFPVNSIKECMKIAGIDSINDIDFIGHCFDYSYRVVPVEKEFEYYFSPNNIIDKFEGEFNLDISDKLLNVPHHIAHAYSAVKPSSFKESLCVIADGMGELESISIFKYSNSKLEKLYTYPISASVGIIYSIITRYLGFEFNMDEYKVMGMAAYGEDKYSGLFSSIIDFSKEGRLKARIPGSPRGDDEYINSIKIFEKLAGIESLIDGTDRWLQSVYSVDLTNSENIDEIKLSPECLVI